MEPDPTARGYLLLHKSLGRHGEGINPFDSMGKGHERSLWKQEAQVKAHCPAAPDAHGTAFALGTDCPEVRGTPSMRGTIPAALPVPSQRLPLIFTGPRASVSSPNQLLPNCSDLPFPDPYHPGSSPIYSPNFLNCSYFHYQPLRLFCLWKLSFHSPGVEIKRKLSSFTLQSLYTAQEGYNS